ncbi:hypothetical protein [Flindersiella endophytica]
MPPALAATVLIADRDSSQWVGPGLLGFVVIVALCAGTYLLWRNMNKQIKKVDFDDGSKPEAAEAADAPGAAEVKENGDQPTGSPKQR